MLQVERTERVHDLLEEGGKSIFLKPLRKEVLTAEGELVDVGVEEDVVDGDGWLTVRPHPFIGHYVDEKSTVFAGYWIVLDDLDTYWGFTVDGEQGDSNEREVTFSLD